MAPYTSQEKSILVHLPTANDMAVDAQLVPGSRGVPHRTQRALGSDTQTLVGKRFVSNSFFAGRDPRGDEAPKHTAQVRHKPHIVKPGLPQQPLHCGPLAFAKFDGGQTSRRQQPR